MQLFIRKCFDQVHVLPTFQEMNEIMKIITSLEESRLLTKDVSEAIKNQEKEQKGEFF